MKKDDGIKRICGNCRTKFYSFGTGPIMCPKCNTEFSLSFLFKKRISVDDTVEPDLVDDDIEVEDTEETTEVDRDATFVDGDDAVVFTAKDEVEE